MDIFKLIFQHDIILEHLAGTEDPRHTAKKELSLADFMKPAPTYTKYYLTGTRLDQQKFGLSTLSAFEPIVGKLKQVFAGMDIIDSGENPVNDLAVFLKTSKPYDALVIGTVPGEITNEIPNLAVDEHTNVRDRLPELTKCMDKGLVVLYVEKAHDGIDFHIFSARNLYEQFFQAFQPMVGDSFRYFSINGKRVGSERAFYFETWTLDRPPHGFEEVFSETRLR